jgi:hypothetical protein
MNAFEFSNNQVKDDIVVNIINHHIHEVINPSLSASGKNDVTPNNINSVNIISIDFSCHILFKIFSIGLIQ